MLPSRSALIPWLCCSPVPPRSRPRPRCRQLGSGQPGVASRRWAGGHRGAERDRAVGVADDVGVQVRAGYDLIAPIGAGAADLTHPLRGPVGVELEQERIPIAGQNRTAADELGAAEVDSVVEAPRDHSIAARVHVVVEGLVRTGPAVLPCPPDTAIVGVAGREDLGPARAQRIEAAGDHNPTTRVGTNAVGIVAAGATAGHRPLDPRRIRGGRAGWDRKGGDEQEDRDPDQVHRSLELRAPALPRNVRGTLRKKRASSHSTSGLTVATNASASLRLMASTTCRTIPTFSCDIAYSDSPAASRAGSRSVNPSMRVTLPSRAVHTIQPSKLVPAPLCCPRPWMVNEVKT